MDIYCRSFPAHITVTRGVFHFPITTIHLYKSAPDEPHDLLILTADAQPATSDGVLEYADSIIQEFVSLNISEVFALAAYEQEYQIFFESYSLPPTVFISASSEDLLDRITQISGTLKMKNGVINGANGVIPSWAASMYNMKGACLLGETLGMIKMDYRAAKAVLETLSDLVRVKADFDILDYNISKVVQFIEWAKNEINPNKPLDQDESSSG